MPFYIRKAISVGPLRFNLSKSGIGVSVGIPGFRIGSGAKGNYVHAGRGGLYYRKTLSGRPIATSTVFRSIGDETIAAGAMGSSAPQSRSVSEFESGSALEMVDASAQDLLDELNGKRSRRASWQTYLWSTLGLAIALYALQLSLWLVVLVIGLAACFWRYQKDQLEQHCVSLYELDADREAHCRELHSIFDKIRKIDVWHIEQKRGGKPGEPATVRFRISPGIGSGPIRLRTNVPVPYLQVGHQTLHFLPDRILVEAPEGYGAVNYSELVVSVEPESLIPGSAGIALCERIRFTSASGLSEVIRISTIGLGEQLRQVLTGLA